MLQIIIFLATIRAIVFFFQRKEQKKREKILLQQLEAMREVGNADAALNAVDAVNNQNRKDIEETKKISLF